VVGSPREVRRGDAPAVAAVVATSAAEVGVVVDGLVGYVVAVVGDFELERDPAVQQIDRAGMEEFLGIYRCHCCCSRGDYYSPCWFPRIIMVGWASKRNVRG